MMATSQNVKEAPAASARPQFGGRFLVNEDDVFKHNAWDNVEWGEKQEQDALAAVSKNSKVTLSAEQLQSLEDESASNWDKFYCVHQNKFFKNRNWLFTEFPELAPHLSEQFPIKVNPEENGGDHKGSTQINSAETPSTEGTSSSSAACSPTIKDVEGSTPFPGHKASHRILELGCGVGNTIFPLLHTNSSPNLFVYGGDFSPEAITIIKQHEDYDTNRCNVFVLDITSDEWTVPFPVNSLDVVTLIYVLSAIHPNKHRDVVRKAAQYLRPGGVLLFRDYGRYDLAQLRFKQGKCLAQNYYMRGDGTKSYFFTQDEVRDVFTGVGLQEKQNIVDRRLQVNRGKQLTMYRVWVQAKYIKL